MGYYLEVPENLHKAAQLRLLYDAMAIEEPASIKEVPPGYTLICVVENGSFDAAAICYSQNELDAFRKTPTDRRPRTWMLMNKAKVIGLCPRVEKVLAY